MVRPATSQVARGLALQASNGERRQKEGKLRRAGWPVLGVGHGATARDGGRHHSAPDSAGAAASPGAAASARAGSASGSSHGGGGAGIQRPELGTPVVEGAGANTRGRDDRIASRTVQCRLDLIERKQHFESVSVVARSGHHQFGVQDAAGVKGALMKRQTGDAGHPAVSNERKRATAVDRSINPFLASNPDTASVVRLSESNDVVHRWAGGERLTTVLAEQHTFGDLR
jgi:hypothetical protein